VNVAGKRRCSFLQDQPLLREDALAATYGIPSRLFLPD